MTVTPEILLIDDDQTFCTNLKSYFQERDMNVSVVSDASMASAIDFRQFKVLLLDLDMPAVSGLDIVKRLPKEARPLVVMVSGHNDFETRMLLLDQGADFFVAKPVELEELFLISKRALGRTTFPAGEAPQWVLHRSHHSLTTPSGETFGLSASEFRVLEQLIRNAPDPAAKADLVEAAKGQKGPIGPHQIRSLEVLISQMRTRFGPVSALPVKSLRNMGYVFHGNGTIADE